MQELTDILKRTEALLVEVEENLKKLRAMNSKSEIKEKVQPLLEKHAEAQKALDVKEDTLLAVLLKLAWLSEARTWHCNIGYCFDYQIVSATTVRICGGDEHRNPQAYLRKSYTPTEFNACRELWHYDFYDWLYRRIADFLKTAPNTQATEKEKITTLAEALTGLAESDVKSTAVS